MVVCNFDMQFIFVVAGWEGTAHDARIFLTTIRNHALNFPKPPKGMVLSNLRHVYFIYYK